MVGGDERCKKINILTQAMISQAKISTFSLVSDVNYINQSAGRLCRSLFEISLQRNWAGNCLSFLKYCVSMERKSWFFNHPLRQFNALPEEIVRKLETRLVSMPRLQDLDSMEIGKIITNMRSVSGSLTPDQGDPEGRPQLLLLLFLLHYGPPPERPLW